MDALDLMLLRDLRFDPFQGAPRPPGPWRPKELARRVNSSERLVKDRLRRLEDHVIAGYDVWPNMAALGLSMMTYGFRTETSRGLRELVDAAKNQEGFLGHAEFMPNWVNLVFARPQAQSVQAALAWLSNEVTHRTPTAVFQAQSWPLKRPLSNLDWRILQALRGDARRPQKEVAQTLGTTVRTLQRRLDAMALDGLFDTFVRLRPQALEEILFSILLFKFEPEKFQPFMRELHGVKLADAWFQCNAHSAVPGSHVDLVMAPRLPSELRMLVQQIEEIPGVVEVEAHLASDFRVCGDWLDSRIQHQVQTVQTS